MSVANFFGVKDDKNDKEKKQGEETNGMSALENVKHEIKKQELEKEKDLQRTVSNFSDVEEAPKMTSNQKLNEDLKQDDEYQETDEDIQDDEDTQDEEYQEKVDEDIQDEEEDLAQQHTEDFKQSDDIQDDDVQDDYLQEDKNYKGETEEQIVTPYSSIYSGTFNQQTGYVSANGIRKTAVFEVEAGFVDWFLNDIPAFFSDTLETRKLYAINRLTRNLMVQKNNKAKEDEEQNTSHAEVLDHGGYFSSQSEYISKHVMFLIDAVRFYDGQNGESLDGSNWTSVNSDKYLQELMLISVNGEQYVADKYSDYQDAIQRMISRVSDDSIKLNYND